MAGLHLLLQADRHAPERRPVRLFLVSLRPAARPLRGQRLGLVLLPGRRGVRHVSPAVHPDPEQPHDRGLQCVLRALQFLRIWDDRRRSRLAVRGGRVLRGVHGGNELPALAFLALLFACCCVRFPRQTLLYFLPAAAIPLAAFLAAQYVGSASSSWPTSRSAPTNTCTKGASGRRRWSWTISTSTPSLTASTCST